MRINNIGLLPAKDSACSSQHCPPPNTSILTTCPVSFINIAISGFEVTSVVLGALPLVISALELYAEGVGTAKRYLRYKTELESLILHIDTERAIFVNTIEQLLTGIMKLSDVVKNGGDRIWQELSVDSKLENRLRGAYEIYIDNAKGMEVALEKIMDKL